MSYVGKRATAQWLAENAPSGTIVVKKSGLKFRRISNGSWVGRSTWAEISLSEEEAGYKILRWGDPWNDLEWVEQPH